MAFVLSIARAATAAALAVQTVTLRFVHGDARARGYLGQIKSLG
jgi:hypothetical protein